MPNIKVEPTIPNYPPQGIQAQLDLLYLWNPDAANDLIDQLNTALEEVGKDLDNYLTKAEAAATYATQTEVTQLSKALEEVEAKVSSVYRFRGSVATYNDLPTEGNVQGDVWNVEDTGANYAWDGTKWDKLSETIDLTPYLTKEDAASTYATITTVNGKQDALTAEQLAAVNSGITAAKVASYDAYAGEISTAQSTADKADGAAEVAQQTANLAGQEAAQALTALAGKVNIAQGTENSGKVMTVGEDGNLAPAAIPAQPSGGIVWDKSVDLVNAQAYTQYGLSLDLGQLATGHYRVYIKGMLSSGLIDNEGNELFLPYTTVAEFYYDATNNSAIGTASPVLDTHTVLNNTMSIPTTETMILLSIRKTATGNVLFWSSGDPYYSISFQKETTLHDAFQVSKITNMDTGEEFSAQSLSYNTGEMPADATYVADLSYYGIDFLTAARPTKTIEPTPGGSAIYGVISANNWIFINPTQEAQYAAVSQIGMEPGLGEFLVCICEQNMSTQAIGDMAVFKLFLSPTKAEYERISATGKFANLKPFIEKTDSSTPYSSLTFRNYDWSEIQISSENQLVCFTSYYGAMTPTAFALSPLDYPLNTSTDIYEIPEKESAQALPDQAGNAGKFLTTDGTNVSWGEVQAAAITTDATLTGTGAADSPLGIAQSVKDSIDGKLPLAGGEFANGATVVLPGTLQLVNEATPTQHWNITAEDASSLQFTSSTLDKGFTVNMHAIRPLNATSMDLGGSGLNSFDIAYIHGINNGAEIAIPTTGGTMALLSDIPDISNLATKTEVQQEIQDAIGTIETALAEV